jgi:hypothetical protein
LVAGPAPVKKGGGAAPPRVWLATSTDGGATFSPERPVWDRPTGACACCGMRLSVAADGTLFLMYRGAREQVNRGMYLLTSVDHGRTFRGGEFAPMKLGTCLMSTAAFAHLDNEVLAAWETSGKVFWGRTRTVGGAAEVARVFPVGAGENQKYPSLVIGPDGNDILAAWTERTRFGKGGRLVWQAYDSSGKPTRGERDDLPAFDFPAAFNGPDGNFVILY